MMTFQVQLRAQNEADLLEKMAVSADVSVEVWAVIAIRARMEEWLEKGWREIPTQTTSS